MCPQPKKEKYGDLAVVIYARDDSEAQYYRVLLEDHEIQVVLAPENDASTVAGEEHGIPILVPEEHLAVAQEIIEQRLALDEEFELDSDDYEDEEDDDMDDYDDDENKDEDLGDVDVSDDTDDEDYY